LTDRIKSAVIVRILCLTLILANTLFFVWSRLLAIDVGPLERPGVAKRTEAQRILLARESTRRPEPPVVRDVQPPRVEPADTRSGVRAGTFSCTSVGPFAALPEASKAQVALQSAGFDARQRVEQGELWVGYWVSMQDLASRQAADDAAASLTARGVKDVYVMPGVENGYVLSLGVFSDYQRAQRRRDEIRALGFQPRIDDRKRTGSVYWIDVHLKETGQLIDTSIFQTDPGRIMRLELRACPAESP
jgi:hypothetical protein